MYGIEVSPVYVRGERDFLIHILVDGRPIMELDSRNEHRLFHKAKEMYYALNWLFQMKLQGTLFKTVDAIKGPIQTEDACYALMALCFVQGLPHKAVKVEYCNTFPEQSTLNMVLEDDRKLEMIDFIWIGDKLLEGVLANETFDVLQFRKALLVAIDEALDKRD